jgi:hypothetical protein
MMECLEVCKRQDMSGVWSRNLQRYRCGVESEKGGDFAAVEMGGKDKKHSGEINIDIFLSDAHGPP